MWGADFDITLDQFRTKPISGLVKIDDSNLSLSGGALQLSSGNKDFTVSTTNSDYKIKKIVFTTTKAIIKYSGDAISENTFQPAAPGTSFTLNLTASGGTAKITQMVVTLTTATSETLEELFATALDGTTYTTGSTALTLTTVGGAFNDAYINVSKSSKERSLTISAASGTNLKFVAIYYYDAIFSKSITASTGTYDAATYTWTPGSTPTNTVKLTFNTGNSEGAKIRKIYVGYEAAATYNATFANGGHGTAPAAAMGVSSVTLTELTESGWINTGWKADKATKVGTTDKAAGATLNIGDEVTLLENTTFTAQWEAEKKTPEVRFKNGAYVVGESALDLSTLFTSQNESAISFALKVASEDATISGNNFTATKEGSYVVVATQDADATYKAVSKEATMVVTYPATGEATIIYNVAVGTSQTTLGTASKEDNSASISGLSDFAFAGGLDVLSGGGKDVSSPKIANPTAKDENKYLYFTFNVADGYEFVISSVSTKVVAVSNDKTIEVALSDTEGTSESLSYKQGKNNEPTEHVFNFAGKAYSGTVTLKIYAYAATEDGYRLGQPLTISGTVAVKPTPAAPAITAPTTNQTAEYNLNDVITPLEVTATGYPAPTYQWYSNTSASTEGATILTGKTDASYTPANDVASDLYYYCVATNATGSATSPYFHVTIKMPTVPTIYTETTAMSLVSNKVATDSKKFTFSGINLDETPITLVLASEVVGLTLSTSSVAPTAGSIADTEITVSYKSVVEEAEANVNLYLKHGDDILHTIVLTYSSTAGVVDLTPISAATTWNWDGANSSTEAIESLDANNIVVFANYSGWVESFKANSLAGRLQYVYRGSNYAQGHNLKFKTTVPGKVFVSYSNTGDRSESDPYRAARITDANGTYSPTIEAGGSKNTTAKSYSHLVAAGDVLIEGFEMREGTPANMLRFYEVRFVPTYTVTYRAGEGTGDDVEDADATNVADVPSTFTAPTGKVFNGWKDESDNDVEVGKIVTGNMTLTAQWIAVYAVTFNLNGHGDAPAAQDIKHGEKVTKPADPSESGWIFGGWYKENTCTNVWDFDNDVVTEDTELFAKWTEDPCPDSEKKSIVKVVLTSATEGTVTGYNNDEYAGDAVIGGLSSTQTAEVDASHDGTETGYKLNNGGSAIVFATLAKGTFQEGDKVVITITKQQDAYKIDEVAQPILDIYYGTNKDDATFLTTIENVTAAGTYTYRLTADDVTAIGTKKGIGVFRPSSGRTQNPYVYSVEIQGCRSWAVFHTLTFKNIDGTATIAAEPLEEGAAASTVAPAAPKIAMKRFIGWSEDMNGTPVDLTTYTIAEDKILYAVYEDIVCPTSGTVYKFEIKDELSSENLPTSTDKDMSSYITVTGDGYLTYTATANNKATINSDGTIQMKDASAAYLKVELECALAAGDQIRAHITGNPMRVQVAATYDSDKDLILAKDDYTFVDITSAMEGKQVLYITRSSNGNANLADFEIYRRPILTGVTMDDMIVRVNAVANPELTLTPSNDAIVTAQAWSIVSGSDKITINPATGAVTGVAAGDAVIKVVLNEDENFSATATVHVVNDYTRQDVTGSMKWNWANTGPLSGVAAQENNNVTETLLANIGTMPNNADFRSDMLVTTCQHAYRTNTGNGCWQGTKIMFYTTVPGAVKVNYMGTGGSDEVTLSINNWSNTYTGSWADSKTIVVPAGWVTISASESNKLRIKTITFTAAADLDPAEVHDEAYYYGGYDRNVTEGRYGTICLPNGGVMVGAELYEVAYFGETSQKVFLDNIINGEMEAGRPYIFLPKEGTTQLAVFYTDEANAPQGDHNGLIGFIGASEDEYFNIPAGEGNYILQNNYYREVPTDAWARIKSNRAYIKLSAIDPHESALAPGRRRISMSVYSEQVATGIENTGFESEAPRKVLINGELFIIRGEKMYDAKGQLVK